MSAFQHSVARARLTIAEDRFAALIFSLWVSLCAACPEFIWRGLKIAFAQTDALSLESILLVGIILTIFIEPLIETLRCLIHRTAQHRNGRRIHFAAVEGFVFALAAIEIHDAILSFFAGMPRRAAGAYMDETIRVAAGWAMQPFLITVCWLAAQRRAMWLPAAIAFAASFWLVFRWFGWTMGDVLTTAIPCLAILAGGTALMRRHRTTGTLRRCAWVVAGTGGAWLALNAALWPLHLGLLGGAAWWVDLRYFAGWTLGLLLAPSPFLERHATPRIAQ